VETVTVKKAELIEKLAANRDAHKATYEEAKANYRQKVIDELRKRAGEIEGGADISTHFMLPQPEDHTSDYEEALEALQWHQDDTVELDRMGEFQSWVLNKWNWDRSFLANTTSYTAAARR
jgi:hypothetical protein